jgi:hypothetical protein
MATGYGISDLAEKIGDYLPDVMLPPPIKHGNVIAVLSPSSSPCSCFSCGIRSDPGLEIVSMLF